MNSAQTRRHRRALRRLEHELLIDAHKHGTAIEWCEQHFGKRWSVIDYPDGMWTVFWAGREATGKYRFCFAEQKDMSWFALRWS